MDEKFKKETEEDFGFHVTLQVTEKLTLRREDRGGSRGMFIRFL